MYTTKLRIFDSKKSTFSSQSQNLNSVCWVPYASFDIRLLNFSVWLTSKIKGEEHLSQSVMIRRIIRELIHTFCERKQVV